MLARILVTIVFHFYQSFVSAADVHCRCDEGGGYTSCFTKWASDQVSADIHLTCICKSRGSQPEVQNHYMSELLIFRKGWWVEVAATRGVLDSLWRETVRPSNLERGQRGIEIEGAQNGGGRKSKFCKSYILFIVNAFHYPNVAPFQKNPIKTV